MARRGGTGGGTPDGGQVRDASSLPNLSGDLDELFDRRPAFRMRVHGYDPLQVDNYAAWAEGELRTLQRQVDHLLTRFGACSAELEISRRLLADAPKAREAFPVSDRVTEMFRLASDEAAAMTEAGTAEAEHILAEARTEADARLRKAHQIKEMAVAAADELQEYADRERAEATALLDRARREAAEILRTAEVERDRLAADAARERELAAAAAAARLAQEDEQARRERESAAAEAAERLAAVQAEVDDLRAQRDQARESLRRLTDQIGQALQGVLTSVPEELVVMAARTEAAQTEAAQTEAAQAEAARTEAVAS
jgi:colicin import membrane protein